MKSEALVLKRIEESIMTKELLKAEAEHVVSLADVIGSSLHDGGKLIIFGNGGSAADAQHIAAEFTGRYLLERKPLPAIAITTNTSSLTAIGNDYGYDSVFERQIEALCTNRDVAVGISTSGKSKNVNLALKRAKMIGAKTAGLTGKSGGDLMNIVDIVIRVPSYSTPRIQECHILVGHIISELVEAKNYRGRVHK